MANKIIQHFNSRQSEKATHELTSREVDVLTLIAKGLSRKEIASLLDLTLNTVSSYVKTIYSKLDVNSKSEATIEAAKLGFVHLN